MTDDDLNKFVEALKAYGTVVSVAFEGEETRGATTLREYRIRFQHDTLEFDLIVDGAGEVRFQFEPGQ